MRIVLGIDGGGSKTRALAASADDGRDLGAFEVGSSNPKSVGTDAARKALDEAARGALAVAGATRADAACFGIAGLDRDEDRAATEAWARAQAYAPASRLRVVHDSALVLAAGTPEGWGLGLVCGTGSVAFGAAARDGRRARAGGWGWLMGDEGSGYALGVDALRVATQHADRRRTDGARILAAVLEAWDIEAPDELLARAYDPKRTRSDVAKLALALLRLADDGDGAARGVVARGAAAAGLLVATVERALDAFDAPLAVAGGLVVGHAGYRAAVCAHAGVSEDRVHVVEDPARGALAIARRTL